MRLDMRSQHVEAQTRHRGTHKEEGKGMERSDRGEIWKSQLAAVCVGLTVLGLSGSVSAADTVRLRNGDVISGKLLMVAGGNAIVETVHSGEVTILIEEVVAIATDRPMTVVYEDGREVDGVIETSEEGIITVREGAAPEAAEPEGEPPAALDLADIEAIHEVTPYYRYVGNLDFGLAIAKGNSDNENINFSGFLAPSWGKNTIVLSGRWNRGEADGELNASNWRVQGQYEREFWKRWFFLLFNSYEADKLQELDLRITAGTGLGYWFFKPDPTLLRVSLGPAFVDENFEGSDDDRQFAALRWTLDFDQDLWSPDVSIYHNHILTVGLTEDQLIMLTAQGLKFGLIADLALKAEFQWDYNKSPADGAKSSDYRYLLKIVYDFGGDENDWLH
jgi:putative salt-induced outer membrane protein YdiY